MTEWPSEWTVLGVEAEYCHHMWKMEPHSSYDQWAFVTDEGLGDNPMGIMEFRQCVSCGTKQIREPPS